MQRLVSRIVFFLTLLLLPAGQVAAELPSDQQTPQTTDSAKTAAADKTSESTGEADKEEASPKVADSEGETVTEDDDRDAKKDQDDDDDDEAKDEQDEETDARKKSDKKKPKPHQVETDELKIEVELDGIFVADEMEEIALRPEVWSRFKVVEAVEHGTNVKKGDVLVRFDDEDLEEDLEEEALEQNIGQLALLQDEEEFPRIKRLLELSFENAERRYERTKADYEYYHSTDRPFTVQIANFRYKSAVEELASAQEELDQLQQMYEADELTEQTEEIVLRRQRFEVETAELILELNKESRDYTLNVSLPRSDEFYESSLEEAKLEYQQAKTAVEMGATRKSYEMEKKRDARAKSVERHGKLLSDKALMTLRAPCDGVAYYGKCINGKFSQISTIKAKLKPFGTVTANTVLMTIVKPGALHVVSSVSERDLPDLKTGMLVTIEPTADSDMELKGKVAAVQGIPGVSNKFRVTLEFDNEATPEWLVAGMTCDASVVVYENEEAIVVPQDLVQTDQDNEKVKYVMLVDPESDEPVRRKVKLGRKQGKLVEILKGLEAGDEIVKEQKDDED